MVLIFTDAEDTFARSVQETAWRTEEGAVVWDARELAFGKPRVVREPRFGRQEFECAGRSVRIDQVSGALVRLSGFWWRAAAGAFETMPHETVAFWYSFLWSLPCPVINRFGLSWWTDHVGYRMQLALHLGAHLNLCGSGGPSAGTQTDSGQTSSFYFAGEELLPANGDGSAVRWAESRRSTLRAWQAESGIHFGRVDLVPGASPRVLAVDPLPNLSTVPGRFVERLSGAVLGSFSASGVCR